MAGIIATILGLIFFTLILAAYFLWADFKDNKGPDEIERPKSSRKLFGNLQKRRVKLLTREKELVERCAELEAVKEEVERTKKEIGITHDIAVAEIELRRVKKKLEQLNRVRKQMMPGEKKKKEESA
ncbi:MAG: hypothetical protein E3J72_04720 [Planctomycetota bacterium]|nr:MAG: hypothetical protein E3J72_04720 [Planctomycetota bacterium]